MLKQTTLGFRDVARMTPTLVAANSQKYFLKLQTFMDTSLLVLRQPQHARHIALHLISLTMPVSQHFTGFARANTFLIQFGVHFSSPTPSFFCSLPSQISLSIEVQRSSVDKCFFFQYRITKQFQSGTTNGLYTKQVLKLCFIVAKTPVILRIAAKKSQEY
jgi:hypothetical protein